MKVMGDISRQQALARAQDAAFVFEDRRLSFGELDRRASAVANGLLDLRLPAQSRVAYLARNTPAYFELQFGTAKSRHVIVGINTRLALPEIEYILHDAEVRLLLVGAEFYDSVAKLLPALPELASVIALDGNHPDWPAYDRWRDSHDDRDPQVEVAADDDFEQLYTSGTTGHPKGVRLAHGAWMRFASALVDDAWSDYTAGDVTLLVVPVFHVAGSNSGLLAVRQGACCVMTSQAEPQEILSLIARYRVNHLFLVPALILMLLRQPNVTEFDFSSLKAISYGASPIAEAVLTEAQRVFDCQFIQMYGLTENLGGATWLSPDDHAPERNKLRSCGKPYGTSDVRIVDTDGRQLAAGEIGEVCLRSSWLMRGYWRQAEATRDTLRDGWLYTGDAGYLDDEGYLFIHDRIKDMIVSGGENVYPAEVENALFGHPAVADAAVIGVPDESWGEAVKAIVVRKAGAAIDERTLVAHVRACIAGFKVPKSIEFVDELPRNPSGKVLRRELRQPYWAGRSRNV